MSLTDLIRRRPDRGSNAGGGSGACAGDYENNVGLFEFDVDDPDFITTSPTSPSASVNVTSNMAHSNARNAVVQRCANYNNLNMSGLRKVASSPMTLTSLHRPKLLDQQLQQHQRPINDNSLRERTNSMSEVDVDSSCSHANAAANDNILTIENLRLHLNSCFSCGVSWQDQHVSLDCSECGGYSLSRPCPLCEGQCGRQWKRDLAASHSLAKANWNGVCSLNRKQNPTSQTDLIIHRLHGLGTS